MNPVKVTIFFVGIAAVINNPPRDAVMKEIIFPAAKEGRYYHAQKLTPHNTYLYIPGKAFAYTKDATATCEKEYGGRFDATSSICTLDLHGAHIWTRTSQALTETDAFRQIPRFSTQCPGARDVPARYTATPLDNDIVAAKIDIAGGEVSGCTRAAGAFVTQIDVATNDGVLYVHQDGRTMRILLNDLSAVAIENKPVEDPMQHDSLGHYGWYHYMNGDRLNCDIVPNQEIPSIAQCIGIPGVADNNATASISGPDCGNSNYP